jgi:hypothetical protein
MASNAPQGPGWWQASDGNWYPPEQHPSDAAPPPPAPAGPPGYQPAGQTTGTPAESVAPPSYSGPPPSPQYPAPTGQTFSTGAAAFTAGIAKLPFGLLLLFGGIIVAQIGLFLPWASANDSGLVMRLSQSGVVTFVLFAALAGSFALAWATFARPRIQRPTLIGLTVVIGLLVIELLYEWFSLSSKARVVTGNDPGVDVSPSVGLLVYTAAIAFLAVRIVMHWRGRSNA